MTHHTHGSNTKSNDESATQEHGESGRSRHEGGTKEEEETVEDQTLLSTNISGDWGGDDRTDETDRQSRDLTA